ncbi:MAG: DUF983 domain-containing protein [Acidimicrobiales bacterium]
MAPSLPRMLARALRRRCPRCGRAGAFVGWARLADACPACGVTYARNEDFFLGAYTINLVLTLASLGAALLGWVLLATSGTAAPGTPALVATVAVALAVPIAGFPTSRVVWLAFDLAMRHDR